MSTETIETTRYHMTDVVVVTLVVLRSFSPRVPFNFAREHLIQNNRTRRTRLRRARTFRDAGFGEASKFGLDYGKPDPSSTVASALRAGTGKTDVRDRAVESRATFPFSELGLTMTFPRDRRPIGPAAGTHERTKQRRLRGPR